MNHGRNIVGHSHRTAWLDPRAARHFQAGIRRCWPAPQPSSPAPYIHIGGGEPRWMLTSFIRLTYNGYGPRPLDRQVSTGVAGDSGARLGDEDVIQYWLSHVALPASLPPQVRAQMGAAVAIARRDVETAAAASVEPLLLRRPLRPAVGRSRASGEARAASACGFIRPRPSPRRSTGNPLTCWGPL